MKKSDRALDWMGRLGAVRGPLKIWALFTVLALVFGTEAYLFSLGTARPVDWSERTLLSFAPWYAWALATPVVVALARRFRSAGWGLPRVVLAHAAAAAVLAPFVVGANLFLAVGIKATQGLTIVQQRLIDQAPWTYWVGLMVRVPVVYGVIVGVTYAFDYSRRLRRRELDAARLESRLHQAQLQALRAQLNPHFLFNTLNAISTLIHDNPAAAERTVALLADFLRAVVHEPGRQEVQLREELALMERYLAIEKVRFADRIRVEIAAAGDTLDALVPSFLLQPLVENALRHGIAPRSAGGTLTVLAARTGDRLELSVEDDGVGPRVSRHGTIDEGVGLANTRARLSELYGEAASIAYGPAGSSGFRVALSLPLRLHEDDAEADAAAEDGGTPLRFEP